MCKVLGAARSGYYNWLKNREREPTERERKRKILKQKISHFFHESFGTYGSPRIYDDLIEAGYVVSQTTVARLMREMGLKADLPEKYVVTTDSDHDYRIYPNLLKRNFEAEAPNRVWVTDITYIRTFEGWVYVASVLDLFSRKIVGLAQSAHMRRELVINALKMALTTRQPSAGLIHHSDRGAQYCSDDYIELLDNMKISMSRKGDPYDNACIESFHATLKKDLIYRRRFETREEAIKAINHYIHHFYNERRKHSTLGNRSPNDYERLYQSKLEMQGCVSHK